MDLISLVCLHRGERLRAADTATDIDTDTAANTAVEMHKRSAVKRSRRAQTVLGDRHDLVCEILLQVMSVACGTRPAEFFNGWVRKRNQSRIQPRNRAREMHLWSAVKSPLGAQTVLGDRHDPVCEILLQVMPAACGTRPRELSSGWVRKQMCDGSKKRSSENLIRQRGQRNDLSPGEFASRAGVRVGEAQHV